MATLMREEQEVLFKKLVQLNVNEHTEQKSNLTYLSWSWAWQEFKKICPEAEYQIKTFYNDITGETTCYLEDKALGYMVFTSVTAKGLTYEMWLPVMDGANKAMKRESYTYTTKYGEKAVEACTMFDINKTIMRCLVKNLAMFGLGLYIYAGEDLPIEIGEPCTPKQIERIKKLQVNELNVVRKFKVEKIEDLTYRQAEFVINSKEQALEKAKGVNE